MTVKSRNWIPWSHGMAKPTSIDISKMDIPELKALSAQIQRRIAELQVKARRELAEDFRRRAAERGFSVEEVLQVVPSSAPGKTSGRKYRNPERPHEVWVGRGRRPKWIHEALERGLALEDLLMPDEAASG